MQLGGWSSNQQANTCYCGWLRPLYTGSCDTGGNGGGWGDTGRRMYGGVHVQTWMGSLYDQKKKLYRASVLIILVLHNGLCFMWTCRSLGEHKRPQLGVCFTKGTHTRENPRSQSILHRNSEYAEREGGKSALQYYNPSPIRPSHLTRNCGHFTLQSWSLIRGKSQYIGSSIDKDLWPY